MSTRSRAPAARARPDSQQEGGGHSERPGATTRRRSRRARSAERSVSRAVIIFAATGLLAVAAVGVVGSLLSRRIAVEQAVDTARRITEVVGKDVVQPDLTDGLLRGDPAAIAAVDRTVRGEVLSAQIVRVKLWTSDGRIVYSDEPRLIGARYTLGADDRRALSTGEVIAAVSDLSRPENRFERPYGKLLEVYLPVRTAGGKPLLFEAYLRFDSVNAAANTVWLRFAPALVLALLALWALQLPFAATLARRIRQGREEREGLLRVALEASEAERRRIAGDLHDGVIQDLAGLSYGLEASADRVGVQGPEGVSGILQRGGATVRETIRQLRGLVVEIYPPNLHATGLGPAISDLLASLASRGIRTSLDVPPSLRLDADEEALVYRAAREALRNVVAHANAGSVRVVLSVRDATATLSVEDDGRGFSPVHLESRHAEGHVGLRLLDDLARHAGGSLKVVSVPDRGTTLVLDIPLE